MVVVSCVWCVCSAYKMHFHSWWKASSLAWTRQNRLVWCMTPLRMNKSCWTKQLHGSKPIRPLQKQHNSRLMSKATRFQGVIQKLLRWLRYWRLHQRCCVIKPKVATQRLKPSWQQRLRVRRWMLIQLCVSNHATSPSLPWVRFPRTWLVHSGMVWMRSSQVQAALPMLQNGRQPKWVYWVQAWWVLGLPTQPQSKAFP